MKKNFYALKLAGLLPKGLNEQAGPPMGSGPEMGMGGEAGGGDVGGGDDPAALLDQAIDLLNKVKEALGGAAGGNEPPPDQGAGAPPPQGMGM